MQAHKLILKIVFDSLPAIRDAIGTANWPTFAAQLLEQADAMQGVQSTEDQALAVEQLTDMLMREESAREAILNAGLDLAQLQQLGTDQRHHPLHDNQPEQEEFHYYARRLLALTGLGEHPTSDQPDSPNTHEAAQLDEAQSAAASEAPGD